MQQTERTTKLYRKEKINLSVVDWEEKYKKNNNFCHNDGMFATTNDPTFAGILSYVKKMEILIEISNDAKISPSGLLIVTWSKVCTSESVKKEEAC